MRQTLRLHIGYQAATFYWLVSLKKLVYLDNFWGDECTGKHGERQREREKKKKLAPRKDFRVQGVPRKKYVIPRKKYVVGGAEQSLPKKSRVSKYYEAEREKDIMEERNEKDIMEERNEKDIMKRKERKILWRGKRER